MSALARTATLGVALVAGGLLVLGFFLDRLQALYSYLFAFSYVFTTVLGALFLLMIGHACNAKWFVPLRRCSERVVGALPLVAVMLAPLLVFVREIYPWTHYQDLPPLQQEHVAKKLAWLNIPFFVVRSIVYMAVFVLVGELLRRWSRRQDGAENAAEAARLRQRMVRGSVGGLVFVSLVFTLAGWDWVMSLEPAWYSNLFGVYLFAGGVLAALGLLGVTSVAARRRGALPEQVTSQHFHAVGRLELAFVIFWAYIGWAHVLQQWIANLPIEQLWYVRRGYHGWQWEGLTLIVSHFVLPFALLLSRSVKKQPLAFGAVSLWLVLVHAVDVHYLVLPALHRGGFVLHWLDFAALAALTSAALLFSLRRGRKLATVPKNDPLLAQGLAYESQS